MNNNYLAMFNEQLYERRTSIHQCFQQIQHRDTKLREGSTWLYTLKLGIQFQF
jgi:hypothetical protein